ncbi:MAG TPA: E2/UBC family protein [Pseudolabrys sp.]|nr:E2/UBC family protein [Pseudolabrys sp.]
MTNAGRREFKLPEADEDFLARLSLSWETVSQAQRRWLIIYGFPMPTGFTVAIADLAIEILAGYPPGPLDMAYFFPALHRSDGKPIPTTQVTEIISGRSWQRWSRHRTPECPWVPGDDCLETHVDLIRTFLDREPKR